MINCIVLNVKFPILYACKRKQQIPVCRPVNVQKKNVHKVNLNVLL